MSTIQLTSAHETVHLDRPEGRVGYEVADHYPQSQRPDVTTDAVLNFLATSAQAMEPSRSEPV
jgi:hypothetical protein